MKYLRLLLLGSIFVITPLMIHANVIITEVVAINDNVLADEDGDFSDWIEIYNTGTAPENLRNYYLTDNAGQLAKWRFPSISLAPKSFMVVFASDKKRAVAGAPLHTNFKLDGDGEYLALVLGGTNVVSEMAPTYPKQYPNISYGRGATLEVFGSSQSAKVLVPTDDSLGTNWTSVNFNDSAWLSATNGVGYEYVVPGLAVRNYKANIQVTSVDAAKGVIANPAQQSAVYQEVAPFINYLSTSGAGNFGSDRTFPGLTINTDIDDFVVEAFGTITIPVATNYTFGVNSDDGFELTIGNYRVAFAGPRGAANTVATFNFPRAGQYPIHLVYFERNGGSACEMFAAQGTHADYNSAFRLVGDTANGGLRVMCIPPELGAGGGNLAAITTDLRSQMHSNLVSAYIRIPFTLTNLATFESLNLKVRYNDGFVAYLNGVEVARRNAPASAGWNTPATVAHDGTSFEYIDVSPYLDRLQVGNNVLAIHGMNDSANSVDFFVLAELVEFHVGNLPPGYFAPPTPGMANVAGVPTVADPVRLSLPDGVYTSNIVVELTSPNPGTVVRYTLDGSKPNDASPLYSGPLTITNSSLVTARAFGSGVFPSEISTAHYTLLETNAATFDSNLPLLVIDSYGQTVERDMAERAVCTVTVFDTSPVSGHTTLTQRPQYQGRAGVEGRGQTSWDFPKKPYNVEFRDKNDGDKNVSILDFPAESDFVLLNVYNDKTFLNDFLAHELFSQMGHYAVNRRFVEVFWNGKRADGSADPNGKVGTNDYVGLYLLIERIKIDNNRVDISKPESGAPGDPITGGYMWKKDKDSPDDVNFTTTSGQLLKYHDPAGDELTQVQRDWLVNHINEFESTLYGATWRDPIHGYAKYIDVDSFVDLHWIVEFSKQIDGYRLSTYMRKDRGGKITMGPIWDWNLSFGNGNYLQGGATNGWYWTNEVEGITIKEHIWLRQLIAGSSSAFGNNGDPEFLQALVDRWSELRDDVLNADRLNNRISELTNYLNEAALRDFRRWPRLGTYIWPNPNGTGKNGTSPPAEGWHVDFQNPATYPEIIAQLRKYITGRFLWIDSQYLQAPRFSRNSGPVNVPLSMAAPLGTIYYTLDGSDPRLRGGAISPKALVYSGPFTPPANSRIMARAWHTNAWSGPAQATFGYTAPSLAITEIMYHPAYAGTNFNDEDFEYIEFVNPGSTPLDLTGMRLAGGVDFLFPPGELATVGSTSQNFDQTGSPYASRILGSGSGPAVSPNGPSGNYLSLIQQNTGTNQNRIAFSTAATGNYDKIVADFDFRANNSTPAPVPGPATVNNFDAAGAAYALTPTTGANMPTVISNGPSGNYLRLTPALGNLANAVHFTRTAPEVYNTVIAAFDFRITPGSAVPGGSGRADGMAFAFLNTAPHGTNGISAAAGAFSEEVPIASTIGVGFDIYANPGEVNNNHVSVHGNGTIATATPAIPRFDIASGKFHRAEVTIRFEGGRAYVTVKISPDVYGTGGAAETLFENVAINNIAPFIGRVAFSARTGGENAQHDIDNVNVQYYNALTPGGLSLVLLPVDVFGDSGAGSGLTSYSGLPNLTNAFAVNLNLSSLDSVNDVSLHWNGSMVANAFVPPGALSLDNGQFHRVRLEAVRSTDGALVTLSITPNSLGTPATPITVFSNRLVAGFAPADSRVEVAGRSGGQSLAIDVDNLNVGFQRYTLNLLAPGERILVVKNLAAFRSRYGSTLRVAGEYTGTLDNSGERLRLYGSLGEPLLDFRYNDAWYPLSDGQGFSLVFTNPSAAADAWDLASNWRMSAQAGGGPGSPDAAPPVLPPVVINEVLSHSDPAAETGVIDAIELHNPTGSSADVSGWFLTDNFNQPAKYALPANSIIPAGGYLAVYETNFSANMPSSASFGLKAEGEAIYLFSADASGNLTGWFHGFDFGAAEANVSFGRHVISTGDEHLVAQVSRSFGSANSGPRVGPIVISEIMYHPMDYPGGQDNQDYEYIELRNTSDATVPLYDVQHPINHWRLTDAVDFEFPAFTSIPPGGYLLVVSFDPVANPDLLDSFRAFYRVPAHTPILGPYQGKLNNSQDRVELKKPGEMDPDSGELVYILVERISYQDSSPWPLAADGAGHSLHRVNQVVYGNDPANWAAGPATPGGDRVGGQVPNITRQPANTTVVASMPATFTVEAAGPAPLTYQWRFNGNNLPGATNATLVVPQTTFAEAGNYQVVVMNSSGAVDSAVARLSVIQGALILTNPASRAVIVKDGTVTNVSFAVAALGNGPVSYQWQFNGVNLPGEVGSTLTITNVTPTDAGRYSVLVTDGIGTAQTAPATLTVHVQPRFTQMPMGRVAAVGSSVSLTVAASGSHPINYRWRHRGAYISWISNATEAAYANSHTLTIPSVQLTNSGLYNVVVNNAAGNALGGPQQGLSSNALLVVVVPPTNQVVAPGSDVTLSLMATGATTLRYQWRFQGNDLTGATNRTLTLNNVQPAQAGDYSVFVQVFTNLAVTPATFTASLAVLGNPDQDTDGDGMTDGQEAIAGTDPNDPKSFLAVGITFSGSPVVQFQALANKTYTIEYKEALQTNAAWQKLADVAAQPAGGLRSIPDPSGSTHRFYRLVTPQR